jgi:hypothetical protein
VKPLAEEVEYIAASLKDAPDPAAEFMIPGIPTSPKSFKPAGLKYE